MFHVERKCYFRVRVRVACACGYGPCVLFLARRFTRELAPGLYPLGCVWHHFPLF